MSSPTQPAALHGLGQVQPTPQVAAVPLPEPAVPPKPRVKRKLMRQTELVDRVKAYDPDAD